LTVAELNLERDKLLHQQRAQAIRQAGDVFLDPGPLPRLHAASNCSIRSSICLKSSRDRLLMVPEILRG
jgi:hypothetical protein